MAPHGKKVLPVSNVEISGTTEIEANGTLMQSVLDQRDQTDISYCVPVAERVATTYQSLELVFHFGAEQIVGFVQILAPNDPSGLKELELVRIYSAREEYD